MEWYGGPVRSSKKPTFPYGHQVAASPWFAVIHGRPEFFEKIPPLPCGVSWNRGVGRPYHEWYGGPVKFSKKTPPLTVGGGRSVVRSYPRPARIFRKNPPPYWWRTGLGASRQSQKRPLLHGRIGGKRPEPLAGGFPFHGPEGPLLPLIYIGFDRIKGGP